MRAEITFYRHHSQDSNLGLSDSKIHDLSTMPWYLCLGFFPLHFHCHHPRVRFFNLSGRASSILTGIQPHPVLKYCYPHGNAKLRLKKTQTFLDAVTSASSKDGITGTIFTFHLKQQKYRHYI